MYSLCKHATFYCLMSDSVDFVDFMVSTYKLVFEFEGKITKKQIDLKRKMKGLGFRFL